jgi:hypothetical protein
MNRALLFLGGGLLCLLTACQPLKVEQGVEAFLPPALASRMGELQSFPGAWWNYVVAIRPTEDLCQALKSEPGLSRVGCRYEPTDLKSLLEAWLRDQPLRQPPPTPAQLLERMNLALAKSGAPLGPEIVEVLRTDPLGSYDELIRLLQSLNPLRLEYKNNFLRFPENDAAAIPLLFDFPRGHTERTAALRAKVEEACRGKCGEIFFIGPHFGTEKNQRVIKADVIRVSLVGTVLFALFIAVLVLTGRWTVLLITAPVAVSVSAAGFALSYSQGSIHGLTVAFGSGLTGIAFDYALHAFVRNSGVKVWHANFIGYLTTLIVFAVMAFSEIPLVREIMLFALIGFTLAYVLFYVGIKLLPERFQIEPFSLRPFETAAAPWVLGACGLAVAGGLLFLRPDFSLQNLDQATVREKRVTKELFSAGGALPPVVRVHQADRDEKVTESELEKEQEFAKAKGMRLVNRLTFLPPLAQQEKNLAGWRRLACAPRPFGRELTETYRRFFAPFFERVGCAQLRKLQPTAAGAYSHAIESQGRWLSTFFPARAGEEEEVLSAFPGAFSLRELGTLFPEQIRREISWMIPLSLLLVVALVCAFYRDWRVVLAIFIPCLTGAALIVPGLALSSSGFGFVSLVGMLMVFGTATDYGVFCANYYLNSRLTRKGIWTALFFAGLVTILGFVPLLFSSHVVLRQLGEPLCLGTLGTLLGVFFVQPWWMRRALGR